ncbi:MAG TPA: hypothetical protein VMT35_15805 [Ignavibacteriaceae bacterium]|nr:hypothetical protein [Ignavibacteriaceae bacterium]
MLVAAYYISKIRLNNSQTRLNNSQTRSNKIKADKEKFDLEERKINYLLKIQSELTFMKTMKVKLDRAAKEKRRKKNRSKNKIVKVNYKIK